MRKRSSEPEPTRHPGADPAQTIGDQQGTAGGRLPRPAYRSGVLRRRVSPQARILVWLLLGAALGSGACAADREGPRPDLDPVAAVRVQIEALGRNDEPAIGHGVEVTWNFASPANRQITGPLERFRSLFDAPVYRPMLDHRGARYSEPRILGERAWVGVKLDDAEGTLRGYLFELSWQDSPECGGCWMTDSVLPMPVERGQLI